MHSTPIRFFAQNGEIDFYTLVVSRRSVGLHLPLVLTLVGVECMSMERVCVCVTERERQTDRQREEGSDTCSLLRLSTCP